MPSPAFDAATATSAPVLVLKADLTKRLKQEKDAVAVSSSSQAWVAVMPTRGMLQQLACRRYDVTTVVQMYGLLLPSNKLVRTIILTNCTHPKIIKY